MIIFKIIGVLLLIILILLIVAICVPVCVWVKYDQTVTLEIKYLFFRFVKEFGGDKSDGHEAQQTAKEPDLLGKILSSAAGFIKKLWQSIKKFCSEVAAFIKRGFQKIRSFVRSKLKSKTKAKNKKRKSGSGGEKTSETKSKNQGLFASLREERGFWGAINFFVDLGKIFGGEMVRIYRGIAADKFMLRVEIVGEDAADTAVKYGRICAVVFPSLSFLLNNMRRYDQDIEITPNFNGEEGRIYFDGKFIIYPVLIIGHALRAIIKFIVLQIKFTLENKKKK